MTLNPRKIWLRYFKRGPWFEFRTTGDVSDDGLAKMDMEWNAAFIKNIRNLGYSGHTEEECVQHFLGSLFLGMAGAMADEDAPPTANPNVQPQIEHLDNGNTLAR